VTSRPGDHAVLRVRCHRRHGGEDGWVVGCGDDPRTGHCRRVGAGALRWCARVL